MTSCESPCSQGCLGNQPTPPSPSSFGMGNFGGSPNPSPNCGGKNICAGGKPSKSYIYYYIGIGVIAAIIIVALTLSIHSRSSIKSKVMKGLQDSGPPPSDSSDPTSSSHDGTA